MGWGGGGGGGGGESGVQVGAMASMFESGALAVRHDRPAPSIPAINLSERAETRGMERKRAEEQKSRICKDRGEQSRTEQNRAEQRRTEENRAEAGTS